MIHVDSAEVRHAYFHPRPGDPERPPTAEELYARAERQAVDECLRCGGDPREEGLGEHGSLIGGPGKPLRALHSNPLWFFPQAPLPLAWFDHPRGRAPTRYPAGDPDIFFAGLSASYLTGIEGQPSGGELRSMFRAPHLSARERGCVYGIFACLRTSQIVRLRVCGGLSAYETARAMELSRTRRGDVAQWINQFGIRPGQPQADAARLWSAAEEWWRRRWEKRDPTSGVPDA